MFTKKIFMLFRVTKNLFIYPRSTGTIHLSCVHNSHDLNKLTTENITETNYNDLNGQNIVTIMKKYIRIRNKREINKENKNKVDFSSDEDFVNTIYTVIKLNQSTLKGPEIVQILEHLKKLSSTSSVTIFSLLLKHLYHCLDDLSLIDINRISALLKTDDNKKLYKDMQFLLSQNFIKKIKTDFEENNIEHLVNVLSFISCNLKNNNLLEIYINKLLKYNGDISLRNSISIFESLAYLSDFSEDCLAILIQIQSNIIRYFDQLNSTQINFLILLISKSIRLRRKSELYNAQFLNRIISKIITHDMGLDCALSALKCLSHMRHLNTDLINYACTKYFEETYVLQNKINMEIPKLIVLISSLALANQKPSYWNKIKDCILKSKEILTYNHRTLCILSLNLLVLHCYPVHILEKIFQNKYDYSNERYLYWTFCKIYQILKENPHYNGPMPSESQIQSLRLNKNLIDNKRNNNFLKLWNLLEKEVGGQKYLITNIFTKLFHQIDFLIVFQKNGIPLAINTNTKKRPSSHIQYLEDCKFPSHCKVVIIQCYPSYWYFRNTYKLLGMHQRFVDTLEAMSYLVIPIYEEKWYSIPESEKPVYLKNEIQSKLKDS